MATNQELLDQAQVAYHALVTGKSPREVVDQNGEKVTFTPANKSALAQYIAQLEGRISPASNNRPMKVFF